MKTQTKILLLVILTFLICHSLHAQEANKQLDEKLLGGWSILVGAGNNVRSLFDISLSEYYRQEGIPLSNCPPKEYPLISDRSGYSSSSLLLGNDRRFEAEFAIYRTSPTDGIKKSFVKWLGEWRVESDTLFLHVNDVKSEGFPLPFTDVSVEELSLNNIFRFSYKIDSCTVRLYPQFDKEYAYRVMQSLLDKAQENKIQFVNLSQSLIPILNNSQSQLSAYTVQQVKEKLEEKRMDEKRLKSNLKFAREIVNQWYKGKDDYANAKRMKARLLRESDVTGKWYINGKINEIGLFNEFINLFHSNYMYGKGYNEVLTRNYLPTLASAVPTSMGEERFELDLKKNNDFLLHLSYHVDGTPEYKKQSEATIDYYGKWSLNNNRLFIDFKGYKASDGRSGLAPYKGELDIRIEDGNLYVSKSVLPDTIYRQVKARIKEMRNGGVFLCSDFLLKAFSEYNSPLLAHEVWKVNYLCDAIQLDYQHTVMKIKTYRDPLLNDKCDIIETVIDKWYEKVRVE